MFNTVVDHMKHVKGAIDQMSSRAAFAFALSCTERQWPAFQQSLKQARRVVEVGSVFRQAIDVGWAHLLQGIAIADELLASCRQLISADVRDAPSVVANTIENSIVDLLHAIQRKDKVYAHHLSGRNIGLIELLLDEHGLLIDDLNVDFANQLLDIQTVRHLVETEMKHQDEDLRRLTADDSDVVIEAMKNESSRISLFSEIWFS